MHIITDRTTFMKATQHCNRIVNRRTTLPILLHVLIETDGDTVKLTATDLENSIVQIAPAKVLQPGRVTVSAEMLHDIIRNFKDNVPIDLQFIAEQHQLRITAGRSKFLLATLNADEFPAVTSGTLPLKFALPTVHLKDLISKTRFAMSSEETMYYLNGIYLHNYEGKELRTVATDGHRLAQTAVILPAGAEELKGVIVSKKTVVELLSLMEDQYDQVTIEASDTQISFQLGHAYLTSRLIDGVFPDYQKVIPTHNDKKMSINMSGFAEAVIRVTTVTDDKVRAIHMLINQSRLILTASGLDADHAQEELGVQYASDEIKIGFNAKYLLDISHYFGKETVAEFAFADATAPVVIRNPDDQATLFVVMPMRI